MSEWKCVNSGGPLVNVDAFGRVRSTGVVVCRWVGAWHVNVGVGACSLTQSNLI